MFCKKCDTTIQYFNETRYARRIIIILSSIGGNRILSFLNYVYILFYQSRLLSNKTVRNLLNNIIGVLYF